MELLDNTVISRCDLYGRLVRLYLRDLVKLLDCVALLDKPCSNSLLPFVQRLWDLCHSAQVFTWLSSGKNLALVGVLPILGLGLPLDNLHFSYALANVRQVERNYPPKDATPMEAPLQIAQHQGWRCGWVKRPH